MSRRRRLHEVTDVMHTTDDNMVATPTVRVVFDGPPFAGKTTAARALSEALGGTVVTPDEDDGRTLWFDWMAYDAGHHGGQPVRVELVTVPGQQDLSDRRRHLLAWGDVVVFVANTSEAVFSNSVASFRELRAELEARPDTPIVVMANKRDLMDAVPMPDVVDQLGLSPDETIIEGIALEGGGIREAFVYAVHAALEHPDRRIEATTADALLDELQSAVAPVAETVVEPATIQAPEIPAPEIQAPEIQAPEIQSPEIQAEPEPAIPSGLTVALHRPELNPAGIADGDAIVILAEHWRVLVDVARGSGPLPRTDDPAEAVIIAELAAWGLLVDADAATAPTPAPAPAAVEPSTPVSSTQEVAPLPALTSIAPVASAPRTATEPTSPAWMSADAGATVRF